MNLYDYFYKPYIRDNFFSFESKLNFIWLKIDRESKYKASKAGGGESSNQTISSSICLA